MASQVQTPLSEKETATLFLETVPSMYYDRLIGNANFSFTNLVQTGEGTEAALKSGKIKDYQFA